MKLEYLPTFISIGENCLIDHILSKYKYKRESYPFGNCRSNIEYITQIIETDFRNFLDKKLLYKDMVDARQIVIKNKVYNMLNDIYCLSVSSNYEFTHHNILDDATLYATFLRRVERFKAIMKSDEDIYFIYYYKHTPKRNVNKIIELLNKYLNMIEKKYNKKCKCMLWYQNILNDPNDRTFVKICYESNNNIMLVEFNCHKIWGSYVNWNAKTDYDLFELFFDSDEFKKFVGNK